MSERQSVDVRVGGWPALLGIAFIVLKLCKVIGWSWWWVLAPFWAPLALVLVVAVVIASGFGVAAIMDCVHRIKRRRRNRGAKD